jgi:hypothetical protein
MVPHVSRVILNMLEDEGTTVLQNGGNHLPNNKESHSIRPQFNIVLEKN